MSHKYKLNTRMTALGAMLTSLVTALIYIGAVTEILDLSLCALASLITVFAVVEFGRPYAFMIYALTVFTSFLLLPSKFAAGAYAFMALYSIIKSVIERLGAFIAWILKLLYFNSGLIICFIVAKYLFFLPTEGVWSFAGAFIIANIAFVLFDIAITRLITLYIVRLRSRFRIDKYIKSVRKK